MKLEPEILRHMWPDASQAKIDTICSISEDVFADYGIDDHYIVAQLMANISHETGAGTIVRESGNYRTDRITEIFGAPHSSAAVTPREAQALAHRPQALFERVYNLPDSPKLAKMLGNHLPGDGYKFRGGGDLQLTGRVSYERIGKITGHSEIVDNPDLLADPKISFRVACAEFTALGCIPLARKRNTEAVRRKVNGGTNGMDEVKVWVRRWEKALPDIDAPAQVPRGADTGNRGLSDSTIVKGAAGTAIATGGTVASTIGTATDTINSVHDTVQTTTDTISTVKDAVHPFLGLDPKVWAGIGIACAIAALIGCCYVGWRRYLKYRDEGV
jgi:putative chitinase